MLSSLNADEFGGGGGSIRRTTVEEIIKSQSEARSSATKNTNCIQVGFC